MQNRFSQLAFGICCALLLIPASVTSCRSQNVISSNTTSDVSVKPASSPDAKNNNGITKPAWRFDDEQEWIVDSIGHDIAEMLIYARYHDDPKTSFTADSLNFKTTCTDKSNNKYKYTFTLPNSQKSPVEYEFALKEYVWEPASYAPFAEWLQQKLQPKPEMASQLPPSDFIKALTDADMSKVFEENTRISNALSATPLDPCLHEQAALLQATIDMLELAGNDSDTRSPLNRMAAHLAIVQTQNGNAGYTIIGKLADIALESLSCRDGVAVKKTDTVAKNANDPIVLSFLRALKIRSSGDNRLFDSAHQTPLEASQFGLRNANYLTADKMLDYIAQHSCTPQVRWKRITLACKGSVGSGHQVDATILGDEVIDFLNDYKMYNKRALENQSDLSGELNKTATRCLIESGGKPALVVLSWDDMAAYHARHIMCAAEAAYNFNEHMFNVPEFAKEVEASNEKLLGKATLFPLTLLDIDTEKQKDLSTKLFDGMKEVIEHHPELLTAHEWMTVENMGKENKPKIILTAAESWFSPPCPMGTAYYFSHRQSLKNCVLDLPALTKLREICPLDLGVCAAWIKKKYGDKPTSAQAKEGYGDLAEFNISAMRTIADADYDEPSKFIPLEEKIAKIDPDEYFQIGNYCVCNNLNEKASAYFQRGIEESEDSVRSSNQSQWLVAYLFDHGQKDKAFSIAQNVAAVYSFGGLKTLADLYDRMGDLKKAEQTWLKIYERYPDESSREYLGSFYLRNANKDKRYAAEANRLLPGYFPGGLKHFDRSQQKEPPKVGLLITSLLKYPEKHGLRRGFIIVGLNGYKTDNQKQYGIVRVMSLDPKMRVIFWDGTKYQEVAINTVYQNRVYVNFKDYKGEPPGKEPAKPSDSSAK